MKKTIQLHFVITAAGTREYIDPVRFISNASTGKMGFSLAEAAIKTGHKVTLITAPTSLTKPKHAKIVDVETSAEMFDAVKKYFHKSDCLIMAAAVSDYIPAKVSRTKIKKQNSDLTIKLKPTTDILKWAGDNKKPSQFLVGFALEDKAIRSRAEKKLKQKKLNMIIANTPSVIGADKTVVQIKTPSEKWIKFPQLTKYTTAKKIIKMIIANL